MSARELVERRLAHDDSIHALAFLPTTPPTLVSGGIDDTIKLWPVDKPDPSLASPTATLTAPAALSCLSIAAPAAPPAAAPPLAWLSFMDGSIRSLSADAAAFQHVLPAQAGDVWTLSHHPTLPLLATGSSKGHIHIYKLTPAAAAAADASQQQQQSSAAADSKAIAAARTTWHNTAHTSAATAASAPTHAHFTYAVAFSPSGAHLAATHHNGTLAVYQTSTGALLHSFAVASGAVTRAVAWCSDEVVVCGSDDGTLSAFDVRSRQQTAAFKAHASYVTALVCYTATPASSTAAAIAPAVVHVVSASVDRRVKVWELASAECLHVFEQHTSSVWAMCKHPSEPMVATGSEDGTIRLFQLPS